MLAGASSSRPAATRSPSIASICVRIEEAIVARGERIVEHDLHAAPRKLPELIEEARGTCRPKGCLRKPHPRSRSPKA